MKALATALVLAVGLFVSGCGFIPGVEPTDLSSVKEETATRAEVEVALGEPLSAHKTEHRETRIYEYNRGIDAEIIGFPHPAVVVGWIATPFLYAEKVDEQEGYLAVVYDKQDRVVDSRIMLYAETPEEAIEIYTAQEREKRESEELRNAAERGDAEAQYKMGSRTRFDKAVSGKWFRLAAEQGHVEAMYALGKDSDADQAIRLNWLRLAAEQGHVEAMYALGKNSDAGSIEQWRWYCLAAIRGDGEAQYELGRGYQGGDAPGGADLSKALFWYTLSDSSEYLQDQSHRCYQDANLGWTCIRSSGLLAAQVRSELTEESIAEVEQLLVEWEPNLADCYEPDEAQAGN